MDSAAESSSSPSPPATMLELTTSRTVLPHIATSFLEESARLPSASTLISSCISSYQSVELASTSITSSSCIGPFSQQHISVEILRSDPYRDDISRPGAGNISGLVKATSLNWESQPDSSEPTDLPSSSEERCREPKYSWEHPSASSHQANSSLDIPSFVHRSISSPVFGLSSLAAADSVENDENEFCHRSDLRLRKRKNSIGQIRYPEPEPPAIRPDFQWYQAKGVIRIHLSVKNVLPTNLIVKCSPRSIDIRLKADNCPYPPTRPSGVPRKMTEYHLPLRVPHRIQPELDFQRISPFKVELHFKKVKASLEWSSLWKLTRKPRPTSEVEMAASSSDSEDDEDRPSDHSPPFKRFMNGKHEDSPTPSLVPLSLEEPKPTESADEACSMAVFMIGAPEEDEDSDDEEKTCQSPVPVDEKESEGSAVSVLSSEAT